MIQNRWRSTLVLVVSTATACYSYQPVQVGELRSGMAVRMQLSAVGVDRVRRSASQSDAKLVDGFGVSGSVAALGTDTLHLSIPVTVMDANVRARTEYHNLSFLRSELQRIERRQLDRRRTTWLSVGIGVGAIAVTAIGIKIGGKNSGTTSGPGTPPENRIPQ